MYADTYQDVDYALAKVLLDSVTSSSKKSYNLTYTECAEAVSKALERKVHAHGGLRMPLYRVAEMCHELGLPLITAIVRLKNDRTIDQVGKGFYTMACEFRPEYRQMEPKIAWKTEIDRVRKCKDWSALDSFLSLHD